MIYLSLDNFAPHSLTHTHAGGEAEAIRFLISPSTSCEDIKPHHELLRWGSMWGPEMVVSSPRQCSVDNLTYLESFKSRLITFYARSLGLARYYREKIFERIAESNNSRGRPEKSASRSVIKAISHAFASV
jgi:hypothetical protein